MIAPDPIREVEAYRASLLAALGDDDPAEAQASTPAAVRDLIASAGDRLAIRAEPGEWSALECLGHMLDAELVSSGRYRWILAHDRPELIGYDQDLWVAKLGHASEDPADLLALFEALRTANLALWARTTPEERARVGLHRERGAESLDLTFRLLAGHDRVHLAQARASLEQVGRTRS